MKAHYPIINLVEGGRIIQGDALIEVSALAEVVWYFTTVSSTWKEDGGGYFSLFPKVEIEKIAPNFTKGSAKRWMQNLYESQELRMH